MVKNDRTNSYWLAERARDSLKRHFAKAVDCAPPLASVGLSGARSVVVFLEEPPCSKRHTCLPRSKYGVRVEYREAPPKNQTIY